MRASPLVLLAILMSGCLAAADETPRPTTSPTAVREAPSTTSWIVAGHGEGEVSALDRVRTHPLQLPAASGGTLVVELVKTLPTDKVYWDVRDANNETVVFGLAGKDVDTATNETFTLVLDEGGAYVLLMDHDPVTTPGPERFRIWWTFGPQG